MHKSLNMTPNQQEVDHAGVVNSGSFPGSAFEGSPWDHAGLFWDLAHNLLKPANQWWGKKTIRITWLPDATASWSWSWTSQTPDALVLNSIDLICTTSLFLYPHFKFMTENNYLFSSACITKYLKKNKISSTWWLNSKLRNIISHCTQRHLLVIGNHSLIACQIPSTVNHFHVNKHVSDSHSNDPDST